MYSHLAGYNYILWQKWNYLQAIKGYGLHVSNETETQQEVQCQ
jgi:hypothetical protein